MVWEIRHDKDKVFCEGVFLGPMLHRLLFCLRREGFAKSIFCMYFIRILYLFIRVAVTEKLFDSQFWKQDIKKARCQQSWFLLSLWETVCSSPSPSFWQLLAVFDTPWLVEALPESVFIFTWCFPCSVCVSMSKFPLFTRTPVRLD